MLTIKEVAKILKLHEMTVYKYIVSGKIKSIRIGKEYRIEETEIQRIMKEGL